MTDRHPRRLMLFLDFDGTISRTDVVDAILEAHAGPGWLEIEDAWRKGQIGSRDCLRAQMALVRATPDELDALLDTMQIDAGYLAVLETCTRHDVPVHIVSDGFDCCIRRLLARAGPDVARLMPGVRVCASHLEPAGGARWRTDFPFFRVPCGHGCATCKPAAMRLLNPANRLTAFVGDGLSDKYAAASADLVFAKGSLAAYCAEQNMAHIPYGGLEDVAAHLRALYDDNDARPRGTHRQHTGAGAAGA